MRRGLCVVWMVAAVVCLILISASLARGQVPGQVNYQGLLTDKATGQPLVGEYEVVFRLYPMAVGGVELWSETDTVEADANGVFAIVLGTKQPIDADLEGPVWLELVVEGETLAPRRDIVSVPFALRAGLADRADSLEGFDAAAFADSAHNHDERYFMETELTTAGSINAPGNPVDWTKLKGVPAGFADGRDSTGGVGDGHSLDAMDGDPIDALLIDDQGDVGIGLTNPQARLDVEDSSSANGTIAIRGVASSNGNGNGIAGVVGEIWSATDFNPGAGVVGSANSSEGRSSGVRGVALGDEGTGVLGIGGHTSGQNYGVVGTCDSPNGYAGYFVGARSYFSGRVGIGKLAPQRKLHVEENSSADNSGAILGVALSPSARWGSGVSGYTYCADTVYVGAGVAGYAEGQVSRSRGVMGTASGSRGIGIEGVALHPSGVTIAVTGSTMSPNGFGCHIWGPRNYFSGKIGIGTETPQNRLHIHESSEMSTVQMTNTATGSGPADGLHLAVTTDGTGLLMNRENKPLDLGVNSAAAMRINANGKISIGGLDTLGTVTVTGLTPGLILNSTAPSHPYGDIAFYRSGTRECGIHWSGTIGYVSIGYGKPLYITSGRVGFNAIPGNPLDITEAGTTWGGVNDYTEVVGHFRNNGGGHTAVSVDAAAGLDPILYLAENGKAYWDLRCDSDWNKNFELRYHGGPAVKNDVLAVVDTLGRVGLGADPDPLYRLKIAGSAYASGSWNSSDERLKDKIEPIAGALAKALALNGVSFEWRRDEFPDKGLPEGRHYGLIAQEVEKVLPEVVKADGEGEKAVAYNEIIPVLVEAIKAQEARIQDQDAKIAALQREVEDLRAASGGGK